MRKTPPGPAVSFEDVRRLALDLPGAEESTSYGTPAFKVNKKLFARFHQDGQSLVLPIDFADRELLIAEQPEIFYITNHYLNYPYVLVRLATVRRDQISGLLRQAWRRVAARSNR